jgi:2-hydroxymuconate-semialdehyde hydrolase
VNGIRTHYLESGNSNRSSLVMLHDGGFGASAEFSWSHNIEALSTKFHVYCPDVIGFGGTEKVFNFENPNGFRIKHLRAWMDTLGLGKSDFAGSSWGANLLLNLASQQSDELQMNKIVAVSPGYGQNAEARTITTSYVPDKQKMKELLKVFFYDEKWYNDPYLTMRYEATTQIGSWEAIAAARFGPPGKEKPFKGSGSSTDYSRIDKPVLLFAGEFDDLAPPVVVKGIHEKIKGSKLHIFPNAKHFGQIERSAEFNEIVLDFLDS